MVVKQTQAHEYQKEESNACPSSWALTMSVNIHTRCIFTVFLYSEQTSKSSFFIRSSSGSESKDLKHQLHFQNPIAQRSTWKVCFSVRWLSDKWTYTRKLKKKLHTGPPEGVIFLSYYYYWPGHTQLKYSNFENLKQQQTTKANLHKHSRRK